MTLNRACGDEQRLCDLAVGEVLAGELGDPALARCQRVDPREHDSARAGAGRAELGLGLFGERSCAGAVSGVERLPEQLSCFGYTMDLLDELASRVRGASELTRLCRLMADERLDGQIELEASWREPSRALDALLGAAHRRQGRAPRRLTWQIPESEYPIVQRVSRVPARMLGTVVARAAFSPDA